jgi:UDP-N-acetylmuramoylalanine--D-glutamate ligase
VRKVALGWKNDGTQTDGRIEMQESEATLWRDGIPKRLFAYESLPLLGRHNRENAAMAMAAIELLGLDIRRAEPLLGTFSALPHRCEAVTTISGVNYVDDSKGTNVAAAVTALESLPGKKIVILGGQGKGEAYEPLAEAVKRSARLALVMGTEREKIQEALQKAGFKGVIPVRDMEEAVERAHREALAGETVLLSPACTSWDAYPNYKERGKHFQRLVHAIQGGEALGNSPERT